MDEKRENKQEKAKALKEAVDELLQKDQLDNDKSHAGDKPGMSDHSSKARPQK